MTISGATLPSHMRDAGTPSLKHYFFWSLNDSELSLYDLAERLLWDTNQADTLPAAVATVQMDGEHVLEDSEAALKASFGTLGQYIVHNLDSQRSRADWRQLRGIVVYATPQASS